MALTTGAPKTGWEDSEFPIVCETCLGDNAYVRMSQAKLGAQCKTCSRPFTVFRWKAGSTGRFKSTILCQMCARMKNVCQTCVLDLKYGLPVEVRDGVVAAAGGASLVAPPSVTATSDMNKQYAMSAFIASAAAAGGDLNTALNAASTRLSDETHATLLRIGRERTAALGHSRNAARLCSFFAKGECNRGDACPYRHELPRDAADGLSRQNVRDRYNGVNDPVAAKVMSAVTARSSEAVDPSVLKLWMGGLPASTKDVDVMAAVGAAGGATPVGVHVHTTPAGDTCAFIEYASHDDAAQAMNALVGRVNVAGVQPRLDWARPKKEAPRPAAASAASSAAPVAVAPAAAVAGYPAGMDAAAYYQMYAAMYAAAAAASVAAPTGGAGPDRSRVNAGAAAVARAARAAAGPHAYASMDPQRMGSAPAGRE